MLEPLAQNEMLEVAARLTPEWLAGFFDGEGCVCARRVRLHGRPHGWTLRVNLTQADVGLMYAIAMQFKAGYGPYAKTRTTRKGKDSTVYEIGWQGKAAIPVLELLDGLVIRKRKQVRLGLRFATTLVGSGNRFSTEVIAERDTIVNELRELNGAGPFKPVTDPIPVSD